MEKIWTPLRCFMGQIGAGSPWQQSSQMQCMISGVLQSIIESSSSVREYLNEIENSPVWNIMLIFHILWHRRKFTVRSTVKCAVKCTPSEYFLGGLMRHINYPKDKYISSNQILVFDPWNNKTWQKEKDMAFYRFQHAVTVIPNIWSFCGN